MFLVTGGAGFLGRSLIEDLVRRGQRVRSLDVLPHDFQKAQGAVETVQADVCDAGAVAEAAAGADVVYHVAALLPIARSGRRFWQVNVEGTRNVLEASLRHGVRKVVHISSSTVYGLTKAAFVEERTPLAPFGEYGLSKAAAEAVCQEFRERGGLDVSVLRPPTILGPGRLGVFEILFDRLRRGRPFFILGSGRNRLQFLSAADMALAAYLIATKPCPNMDFNVGAQTVSTLRDDLQALASHAGTGSRIVSLPATPTRLVLMALDALRLAPFVDYHYHIITHDMWLSSDRLQHALGWSARHSNKDALCLTYDWYLQNRDALGSSGGSPHTRGVKGRLLGAILRAI